MVSVERLSEEPNKQDDRVQQWNRETECCTPYKEQDEDDSQSECGLEIATVDDCAGHFGNIVIKNSSEVQFGNNTYYQGPVTIKQVICKTGSEANNHLPLENGKLNYSFNPDCDIYNDEGYAEKHKKSDGEKPVDKTNDKQKTGSKWLNYMYKKRKLYSICVSSILTVLLILLTIFLVYNHNYVPVSSRIYEDNDEQGSSMPIPPPSGESTLSGKLKIIPRLEWLAQPPEKSISPLNLPVPYVIILHTATENCTDQAKCTILVRYIQTFHLESKGWSDIAYNFLIGGDGYVYEGRGWKTEGANAFGYNYKSIGIAFVGTFNKYEPPARQILACKQLIDKGVKEGYIVKDYKLFAHRQLSSTQSPGEALFRIIQTWPHWTSKP